MSITTVILVHGAWHGAWCWQTVIPELLKRRLAPFTLDLPAHGVHARFPEGWGGDPARFATAPSPVAGITLDDYADAVLEVVNAAYAAGSGPVMLVGHSMAGIALTAVAERAPEKIGMLAYLAAFMPLPGVPMIDYVCCAENAGEEVAGLFVAPPPRIGAMRIDYRCASPDPRRAHPFRLCPRCRYDALRRDEPPADARRAGRPGGDTDRRHAQRLGPRAARLHPLQRGSRRDAGAAGPLHPRGRRFHAGQPDACADTGGQPLAVFVDAGNAGAGAGGTRRLKFRRRARSRRAARSPRPR
jgi:pimeloyl-ACP methyl ester carboxylesterase